MNKPNTKKFPKIVHFQQSHPIIVKGWCLKKNVKNGRYTTKGIPDIGIEIISYINADAFIGFIQLPKPSHIDFGYTSFEWIKNHDVLGDPKNGLITFNGKIIWEIKDIQETTNPNRVLIVLGRVL